jgi:porin
LAHTTAKFYPDEYKFGGVYNGGKFTDPVGRKSSGNYLIYGMASQAVFRSQAGSTRGLDATLGFDWSPGDVSHENEQVTAGVRFNAPMDTAQKTALLPVSYTARSATLSEISERCWVVRCSVLKRHSS